METEFLNINDCSAREDWLAFLRSAGLSPAPSEGDTVILRDDCGGIAACGTREGNVFKYLAVAPEHQGEGLMGTVITALRRTAFSAGISRTFIYTKPKNGILFEDLSFHKVAESGEVLLLESTRGGVESFVSSLAEKFDAPAAPGPVGAIVMNADPFTLGHRYLVERAVLECGRLYVLVLSSDRGRFTAAERLKLVQEGTKDLENVRVCGTGDYLISAATFPDYFLKKESSATVAQCELDCAVFSARFAPALKITRRYAGSEPLSPVTELYNRTMERLLPPAGIEFHEIQRCCLPSGQPVSASRVRALLESRDGAGLRELLPDTTYEYLESRGLI